MNKNIYDVPKSRLSNLLSLINIYHQKATINPEINKDNVRLTVESDINLDFFNLLPDITNTDITLNDDQRKTKAIIEKYLFLKLYKKQPININITPPIEFTDLLQIAPTLNFTVKLFPNILDEFVFIGIGSERLGFYVIKLGVNNICDAHIPYFDLKDGFKSNKENLLYLNMFFQLWVQNNREYDILYNDDDVFDELLKLT